MGKQNFRSLKRSRKRMGVSGNSSWTWMPSPHSPCFTFPVNLVWGWSPERQAMIFINWYHELFMTMSQPKKPMKQPSTLFSMLYFTVWLFQPCRFMLEQSPRAYFPEGRLLDPYMCIYKPLNLHGAQCLKMQSSTLQNYPECSLILGY